MNKLIDRLSEFPELQNLSTDEGGLKTDEFEKLRRKFQPMDHMFLKTAPPDNLHKLYELLWVKITDITSAPLDSSLPSSLMSDDLPDVTMFCSENGKKRNVDYYCSLIRMCTSHTMSSLLAPKRADFFID